MGFAEDIPAGVQGTSRASVLLGGDGRRPTAQLYMKTPHGMPEWGHRGVRTHTHTLVVELAPDRAPSITLFHDAEDPYQLVDVSREQPGEVRRLIDEELMPLLRHTNDP